MAEDQQPDPVETPELAEEVVEEDVFIIVSEKTVLEMLRQAVRPGSDPELLYAEFYANAAIEQVVAMCDCEDCTLCECCTCDEEDDDNCECECTCEYEDEEETEEGEEEARDA